MAPFTFVSFWDVYRLLAQHMFALGEVSNDLGGSMYAASINPAAPLSDEEKADLRDHLKRIHKLCADLVMPVTAFMVENALVDLPSSHEAIRLLRDAMVAELRSKIFLHVPTERAEFYQAPNLQTLDAADAFPAASYELMQAANAYALGLPVASVFHTMRGAEIGVRALAMDLGVTYAFPLELADWQDVLNQIESKIKAMGQLPKSAKKDDDLAFYSPAAAEFRWLKDGWRVRVAHARGQNFSDDDARRILEHTASFFEVLTKRLREPA